jgi:hypothetical protein
MEGDRRRWGGVRGTEQRTDERKMHVLAPESIFQHLERYGGTEVRRY